MKYIITLRKLTFVAIIIALSSLNFNARATWTASGCVSDDTGYMYPNYSGITRSGGYGPSYESTNVVTSFGTGIYCAPTVAGNCVIRSRSNCRECTGPYDYDSSKNRTDNWYEQKGKLTYYMACPIDDYIGFILVAVGGIGVFFIRKNIF